jgi:hypothetical protein
VDKKRERFGIASLDTWIVSWRLFNSCCFLTLLRGLPESSSSEEEENLDDYE